MGVRRVTRVLLAIGCIAPLAACGDNTDTAFCPAYDEYLSVADPILDTDVTSASASDALDAVDELVDELEQLQSVSDGRYWNSIDDLFVAVEEIRAALATAPDDAEYETWQPLVDESITTAIDADIRLREVIDPVCAPDTES